MDQKAWVVFAMKGFGNTKILRKIVYRTQNTLIFTLPVTSFPCHFLYCVNCNRQNFVPIVSVSTLCFYLISLHLQKTYSELIYHKRNIKLSLQMQLHPIAILNWKELIAKMNSHEISNVVLLYQQWWIYKLLLLDYSKPNNCHFVFQI